MSKENCSPYIVSISFEGVRAETLLHKLNDNGVIIGNGSACSSKKSGNRILASMGIDSKTIESSVRISFGMCTTKDEVKVAATLLDKCTKDYKEKVKM